MRRSSKRHGLHTEASHRFERGTDIEAVPLALDRAAALIAELGGGTVLKGAIDEYPGKSAKKTVRLRAGAVSKLLGVEVPEAESARILSALGFEKASGDEWRVPSFRVDVDREEDLIEEVARIRGYDNIPSVLPRGPKDLVPEAPEHQVERRIREALAGAGMMEIVSYSFVTPGDLPWTQIREYEALGTEVDAIAVQNPLSVEQSAMRTTLYAGLLRTLSHNLRHGAAETVRLYEWGRSYHKDPEGGEAHRPVAKEILRVAGVLHGLRLGRHWTASDARLDFFDAKGAVEAVLGQLGIEKARFVPAELAPYHPRACAKVWLENGVTLGTLGELHPRTARALDLPEGIFLFDLEVERLRKASALRPRYEALTKFPSVLRDLAVVVDAALTSEEVRGVILEAGGTLVDDARVFDVYAGKPIPEGRKNLAFALSYRAGDRTLTDAEVNEAHQRIVAEVNRRLGASLRGENAQ